MIRKTAKTMIFRRSFFNTYFDEPLSAGDHRVETEEDFLEGLSLPAYRPGS